MCVLIRSASCISITSINKYKYGNINNNIPSKLKGSFIMMNSIYSKIRGFCERSFQRYGDWFRTTDGAGNFSFMMKEEDILVLYSGKCHIVILQINEDDCGNVDVVRLSPNYDVLISEKAYDLVMDILSGIGISIPDTETHSDVIKTIQDTKEKEKMRLVELLEKTSSADKLSAEETAELEGLCCQFFITRQGSLDLDNFKEVISNCKSKDYRLFTGERDSFGILSAIIVCPNDHRIVFG